MHKTLVSFLLLSQVITLSACDRSTTDTSINTAGTSTQIQAQVKTPTQSDPTQQPSDPTVTQKPESNIVLTEDPSATKTIQQFYQDLNEQNYTSAVSLLGPQLVFEGSPDFIKYLKNIKKTTFTKLEDISRSPGPIDPNYSQYYRIKVYYAEINFEVQDPNLVKGLAGRNYRKFILIKKSEQSPWLIDTDEATPKQ